MGASTASGNTQAASGGASGGGSNDASVDAAEAVVDAARSDASSASSDSSDSSEDTPPTSPSTFTFTQMGNNGVATLERTFYKGSGLWYTSASATGGTGGTSSQDWGVDSMIYALFLRWTTTSDNSVPPIMAAMQSTSTNYIGNTTSWSDVPMWDSIADSREYQVLSATNQASLATTALARAKAAFDYVDADPAGQGFASGACRTIDYQLPHQGGGGLKTLESDSNYIKAALELYQETSVSSYLTKAEDKYSAVRAYFLDPALALYTVYVFDDGSTCTQVARQFFSSVNGNMLWNSYRLGSVTGDSSYTNDAIATLNAIVSTLSDQAGIFESLQQENDSSEEMVEAMWALATSGDSSLAPIASAWIEANATAAGSSITANGLYDRFYGGIAPLVTKPPSGAPTTVSAWQSAGGLALAIAASDIDGNGIPNTTYWNGATFTPLILTVTESTTPRSLQFTGRAIAVLGTMGLSGPNGGGHVYVSLDGELLANEVGVDQGYSETGQQPNTVLFTWRWSASGTHTIQFSGPPCNVKQGCTYLNMTGYYAL
jgi:hypothetical protein